MADPNHAKSIFLAAVDRPAQERAAYLQQATAGNAALRARVEALLTAHDNPDSFLEKVAVAVSGAVDHSLAEPPLTERSGTRIGPYKLLEQIGEGGMGVVYMAEQGHPVQRRVALKIIKPGMDSRQVIARLEAERQALAMMDHPNIARVLDAGTTDSGLPYFVMELVKGAPITDYCDQHHLPLRERLQLFVPVCQAVQHAHQKGIIHRDLKPSNVLIALYDGRPVPKVIDFGVAKATGSKLTERTLFTEFGQVVGTLEYMSPEQAELNQLDIDTRSDIYSLGVLLYELLTGTTPLERKRIQETAFLEVLRLVREEEPPTPSTRLKTAERLPSIAANRGLEPVKLNRIIRGELDWIVMKSLEKDRNRRYDSAGNFAADVLRHLNDEPVEACPPSAAYRFRKFILRNRVGVLACSAIIVALVLGLSLATIGLVQARHQADRADREGSNARTETAKALVAQGQAEMALIDKDNALKAAQEKELLQRRRFYAAQMYLAQEALLSGDPSRVLDLLENNRPQPGDADLRGFEWYYVWHQIHPGLRAVCFHPTGNNHWGLAASRDGSMIAVDSRVGDVATVRLWNVTTGELMRTLTIGVDGPTLLAFSPDGKLLATGTGDDCTICLWNPKSGSELARTSRKLGIVRSLQFAPDGTNLAVGFETGAVQILDAVSLKTIAELKPHGGPVLNVCYSPDGTRLYSAAAWGTEGSLTRVHDMTKKPPEAVDELKDFRVTDISPDGWFLVGGFDKGITLWDIVQRKAVWQFTAHPGIVNDIKFTPDGNSLITGGTQDRLAIRWDISTRKAVMRVPHQAQVTAVACPGGKSGNWASLSDDGAVKIWGPGLEQSFIRLDKPIKTMVMMPFGRAVMLGGDFQAKTWDLNTETFHDSPSAARYVRNISTDGRWLASTEPVEPGNVPGAIIWDLSSGKLQHVIAMPDNKFPEVTRISPEGKRLATSRFDGSIQIWDLTDERVEVPAPLSMQGASCTHLDFSPDGHRLAAACQFGWVNLYDLETDEIVRFRVPRCSWAKRVAFSRDGKLLAAGNDVGLVCVFNIETGNTIASLAGHEASIEALAFFPDGRRLAVASRNTIRIWDVPSSQEMITLTVAAGADVSTPTDVKDLAITPDGRTLLSRQSDGTVRVWNSVGVAADPGDEPVAESSLEPAK